MIDIKTLKQYPLSFKLLEQWVEQKHTTSLALLLDKVTNEELICFLDKNGVFICVCPYIGLSEDIEVEFEADIACLFMESKYCETFFDRETAIESVIPEGFKLLEQKLKVN